MNRDIDSYRDFWGFIEEWLPDYSRRDDVLHSDILLRYLTGEEVWEGDLKWIERDYAGDKMLVAKHLTELESQFAQEALTEYYHSIVAKMAKCTLS